MQDLEGGKLAGPEQRIVRGQTRFFLGDQADLALGSSLLYICNVMYTYMYWPYHDARCVPASYGIQLSWGRSLLGCPTELGIGHSTDLGGHKVLRSDH